MPTYNWTFSAINFCQLQHFLVASGLCARNMKVVTFCAVLMYTLFVSWLQFFSNSVSESLITLLIDTSHCKACMSANSSGGPCMTKCKGAEAFIVWWAFCGQTYRQWCKNISFKLLNGIEIYHTVNRLRSFLSSSHSVIWWFDHLEIWWFGHLVIQSFSYLVIQSFGHPVI